MVDVLSCEWWAQRRRSHCHCRIGVEHASRTRHRLLSAADVDALIPRILARASRCMPAVRLTCISRLPQLSAPCLAIFGSLTYQPAVDAACVPAAHQRTPRAMLARFRGRRFKPRYVGCCSIAFRLRWIVCDCCVAFALQFTRYTHYPHTPGLDSHLDVYTPHTTQFWLRWTYPDVGPVWITTLRLRFPLRLDSAYGYQYPGWTTLPLHYVDFGCWCAVTYTATTTTGFTHVHTHTLHGPLRLVTLPTHATHHTTPHALPRLRLQFRLVVLPLQPTRGSTLRIHIAYRFPGCYTLPLVRLRYGYTDLRLHWTILDPYVR